MPFWRAYYHVTWGTKKRRHVITPELESRLFPALIRKSGELGLHVYALNGWTNHIHIAMSMPPKESISDMVGKLKGNSSHYINDHELVDFDFKWQRGYGVVTFGYTQLERAIRYVENQKQHHANKTTNKWLERVEDWDDGPLDAPDVYANGLQVIKESSVEYVTSNDAWLFP